MVFREKSDSIPRANGASNASFYCFDGKFGPLRDLLCSIPGELLRERVFQNKFSMTSI